jgi:hypothetical protein
MGRPADKTREVPIPMNRSLKVSLVTGAAMALSGSLLGIGALAVASSNQPANTPTANSAANENTSPIYGVTIPSGYREWQAIAPSLEAPPLDELRIIFGNPTGFQAFRKGTLPFPDGTILAKVAWKRVPSTFFTTASFPGQATTVQFMVKDSKKYAATGGWGFGRFVNGKPTSLAEHKTCFACHQSLAKDHDFVITRYAQ